MVYLNNNNNLYYTEAEYTTLANGLDSDTNIYYINGSLSNGLIDGILYDYGYLAFGQIGDVFYSDGYPFTGQYGIIAYLNGYPRDGYDSEGRLWLVGYGFNGRWEVSIGGDGRYFNDGYRLEGFIETEGLYYNDGYRLNGLVDGRYYDDGSRLNGVVNNRYYIDGYPSAHTFPDRIFGGDGYPLNGLFSGIYFNDGYLYTGYVNGKYYIDGVIQLVNLESGLQAFYKLSDTSDSSGNNRTLTNNGNVTFASGKIGNAAVFDGINENYLSLPSDPVLDFGSSDFSASFWINCSPQNAPYPAIISPVNGFYGDTLKICIIAGTENVIGYEHSGSANLESTFSLSNNTWYHVVVKRSNGTSYLYINGSLNNSVYDPNNINLGDGGTVIGGGNWDGGMGFFTGSLDAVGIWNRALNILEVAALYNSGNGLELPFLNNRINIKIKGKSKLFANVKFVD